MSRKVVDCGAEWAACRCFDQILLELGTELATDALDQPFPTLAERCRFRRYIVESAATGERAELALCGRDRLTCGGELVELSQELPDSARLQASVGSSFLSNGRRPETYDPCLGGSL